jgi:hypothetical protein
MISPVTEEHLQVALDLRAKLDDELAWLRLASKSYSGDVFRRLVTYSASRLQWVMQEQMNLGPSRVRFNIGSKSDISVSILWAVRRDDVALAMAWETVMKGAAASS